AEHCRVLEQRFFLSLEQVEPRSDDSLHRLGERKPLRRSPFAQQARELLGVKGVPPGPREELALSLRRQHRALEQPADPAGRILVRKSRERYRRRVRLPAAPRGPALEELRPRGGDDEEWNAASPVDEVVDE